MIKNYFLSKFIVGLIKIIDGDEDHGSTIRIVLLRPIVNGFEKGANFLLFLSLC
jgi:hypothetical protein